jgi:hypothetical protein
MGVPLGLKAEVQHSLGAKQVQHMVEKRDGGGDFPFSGSVQVQVDLNFRLSRFPNELCFSRHNIFLKTNQSELSENLFFLRHYTL